ncbi:50S ribosomal protein L28 [Candidatus Uhrbacteria bacterium]|nr:50S ribosomal protein L28 [Candidatus Uhrbacteria bacterium]
MARKCHFCSRNSLKATSRSHSNIGTLRRQYVNLQKKKIDGVSVLTCTRCLKTIKKKMPVLLQTKAAKKAA